MNNAMTKATETGMQVAGRVAPVAATGYEGQLFVHTTTGTIFEIGREVRRNGPHMAFYAIVGRNGDVNVDGMLRTGDWCHATPSEIRRHRATVAASLQAGMDVPAMVEDASGNAIVYTTSHVVIR